MARQLASQTLALLVSLQGAAASQPELQVVAGRNFGFILDHYGSVWGFGHNVAGRLGLGEDAEDMMFGEPTLVNIPTNVTQIAVGAYHTLFLTKDGTVYGTGRNRFGQLGEIAMRGDVRTPELLFGLKGVTDVAAGYGHSLFLTGAEAYACGLNTAGQLGLKDDQNMIPHTEELKRVPDLAGVKQVAAGYDFSYFLTDSGAVHAAGQNLDGQLGDNTMRSSRGLVTVQFDTAHVVKQVAAGESHGLFLSEDGTLCGTGAGFDGQLGGEVSAAKPREITVGVSSVVGGGDTTIFTTMTGVFGHGSNRDGQLGLWDQNSTAPGPTFSSPQQIPLEVNSLPGSDAMSVGDSHSLFATKAQPDVNGNDVGSDVYACGSGDDGELGDGAFTDSSALTQVIENYKTYIATPTTTEGSTDAGTTEEGGSTDDEVDDNETTEQPDIEGGLIPGLEDRVVWIAMGGVLFGVFGFFLCTSPTQEEERQEQRPAEQATEMI